MEYNKQHGKVPVALNKKISESLVGRTKDFPDEKYTQKEILQKVAEAKASYTSEDIEKVITQKQKEMESAAKNLDFIKAAKLRDEIAALKG
jgi:excinuclease ABC subunit B